MAHPEQLAFFESVKKLYGRYFTRSAVLDIGSLDINGNNRELFEDCLYIGIDVGQGRNVDFVTKGHELALPDASFDVVISSECFEHDQHYPETIANAVRMLRPGGLFAFTCATTGRPEHGTRRTTPEDAPLLAGHGEWSDYYKNLDAKDICAVLNVQEVFTSFAFHSTTNPCDLYFWGLKAGEYAPREHGSFIEAANQADLRRKATAATEAKLAATEKALAEEQAKTAALRQQLRAQTTEFTAATQTLANRDRQIKRMQSTWHQKTAVTLFRARQKARTELKRALSIENALKRIPANSPVFAMQRTTKAVTSPLARKALKAAGAKSWHLLLSSNVSGAIDEVRRATHAIAAMSQNRSVDILATYHVSYIAHGLQATLTELGYESRITYQDETFLDVGQKFIVLCPQMFPVLPRNYIAFQLEQSVHPRWFTDDYFARLKGAQAVLEYSRANIEFLLSKGIEFSKLFYVPISTTPDYLSVLHRVYPTAAFGASKTIDVLFYGDANIPRRQEFLAELGKRFDVKVVVGVFGPELVNLILASKVVVNIHYYEDALLETTRLSEVLSLGVPVVSEASADQVEHDALRGAVKFTPIGDIEAMAEAVAELLGHADAYAAQTAEVVALQHEDTRQHDYFMRFLGAVGLCSFEQVVADTDFLTEAMPAKLCLSLSETVGRRRRFLQQGPSGFHLFEGMRASPGWIGCGRSFKYLARKALETNLEMVTVCEDDALFYPDFEAEYDRALRFLTQTKREWWLFSGLISDLAINARVIDIELFEGVEYIFLDTMISMVFNIYSRGTLERIAAWDDTFVEFPTNCIDYQLMHQKGVVSVTTVPYLVGHRSDEESTLWGHGNDKYDPMIAASIERLKEKVAAFKAQRDPSP